MAVVRSLVRCCLAGKMTVSSGAQDSATFDPRRTGSDGVRGDATTSSPAAVRTPSRTLAPMNSAATTCPRFAALPLSPERDASGRTPRDLASASGSAPFRPRMRARRPVERYRICSPSRPMIWPASKLNSPRNWRRTAKRAARTPRPVPELDDTALAHDRDPVGQRQRLLLIVGDIDDGHAEVALHALDLALQLVAQLAIERAERLVHQQHRRLEHDGTRERHALLLAARELADRRPPKSTRSTRASTSFTLRSMSHGSQRRAGAAGRQCSRRRSVREKRVALKDDAEVTLLGRQREDVAPVDRMPPPSGSTNPAIIISVVVFPDPLEPKSVTNSPAMTSSADVVDGGERPYVFAQMPRSGSRRPPSCQPNARLLMARSVRRCTRWVKISTTIESRKSTQDAAAMIGLSSKRMPLHIWAGRVVVLTPLRKIDTTTSSKLVRKAKIRTRKNARAGSPEVSP